MGLGGEEGYFCGYWGLLGGWQDGGVLVPFCLIAALECGSGSLLYVWRGRRGWLSAAFSRGKT